MPREGSCVDAWALHFGLVNSLGTGIEQGAAHNPNIGYDTTDWTNVEFEKPSFVEGSPFWGTCLMISCRGVALQVRLAAHWEPLVGAREPELAWQVGRGSILGVAKHRACPALRTTCP